MTTSTAELLAQREQAQRVWAAAIEVEAHLGRCVTAEQYEERDALRSQISGTRRIVEQLTWQLEARGMFTPGDAAGWVGCRDSWRHSVRLAVAQDRLAEAMPAEVA